MLRRRFLSAGAVVFGAALAAGCTEPAGEDQRTWRMPDEGDPHKRTWMAFGASEAIWGAALLPPGRCQRGRRATTAKFSGIRGAPGGSAQPCSHGTSAGNACQSM
ncbi:peptidyl-arginine deiminase [Mycolicibacterium neworleansense]|uniref:Peptidyl-arginine deiminase n=1 Tax=Mycolicibacterium neworleansense TaxID=146018 RepID=A0A0H5RY01_9MYCO|nr:peptidyl-arginine deiminase [Mycolicibacterium neworleansense]